MQERWIVITKSTRADRCELEVFECEDGTFTICAWSSAASRSSAEGLTSEADVLPALGTLERED